MDGLQEGGCLSGNGERGQGDKNGLKPGLGRKITDPRLGPETGLFQPQASTRNVYRSSVRSAVPNLT